MSNTDRSMTEHVLNNPIPGAVACDVDKDGKRNYFAINKLRTRHPSRYDFKITYNRTVKLVASYLIFTLFFTTLADNPERGIEVFSTIANNPLLSVNLVVSLYFILYVCRLFRGQCRGIVTNSLKVVVAMAFQLVYDIKVAIRERNDVRDRED